MTRYVGSKVVFDDEKTKPSGTDRRFLLTWEICPNLMHHRDDPGQGLRVSRSPARPNIASGIWGIRLESLAAYLASELQLGNALKKSGKQTVSGGKVQSMQAATFNLSYKSTFDSKLEYIRMLFAKWASNIA